jgi:hypothetical protein
MASADCEMANMFTDSGEEDEDDDEEPEEA